jgi:integrase
MSDFISTIIGRPRTIKTYTSIFQNHIEPHVTPEEAKHFTQQDLEPLAQVWLSKNLRPSTLNTALILLRRYLLWCGAEVSRIDTKPLARKLNRMDQETDKMCLSKEEAEAVLKEAKTRSRKVYLYCLLGFHAGLRRGEILGLKWSDFDALNNRIHVKRTYRTDPTKSGKSRVIPISEDLEKALEEDGYTMQKSDRYVFDTILHHPNLHLASICEKAGVPIITSQGMRHTFATLALESGISPKTVQIWLGHANLGTTLDYYWRVIPNETRLSFLPRTQIEGDLSRKGII